MTCRTWIKPIYIQCNAKVTNISADSVTYEQFGQAHTIEGVDTIVVAMGSTSVGALGEELKALGKPVHVIGDAGNIGKIVNAIADGRKVGMSI